MIYTFTLSDDQNSISMRTSSLDSTRIDGNFVRMAVSKQILVVTCGDCSTPGVTIFKREQLNRGKYVE